MSKSELETSASTSSTIAPIDYYAVLGLQRNATRTDIKKAYGQLAWTWHPLKNLAYQMEADSTFRKIAEAYEILSDDELRRPYDESLAYKRPFNFEFADPYDIFDDFESFKDLKLGDDDDVDISSASENEEDAMSIGSNTDYSRPIITLEYSVTRMVDDNANTDKTNSASSAADVTDDKQAQDDDGESKHENESTRTKSVQLFTETRPNGRTYMTKKVLENGVETLNVVREGDITDKDVAEAERLVEW